MEQKPGVDYYGNSTFIIMLLIIYVLLYFDQMFVNSLGNIFSAQLSFVLLFLMIMLIMERYILRSDQKIKVEKKGADLDEALEEKSFFKKTEMLKRSSTQRSMTVRVKTMKTTDVDLQNEDSQQFLKEMADQQNK